MSRGILQEESLHDFSRGWGEADLVLVPLFIFVEGEVQHLLSSSYEAPLPVSMTFQRSQRVILQGYWPVLSEPLAAAQQGPWVCTGWFISSNPWLDSHPLLFSSLNSFIKQRGLRNLVGEDWRKEGISALSVSAVTKSSTPHCACSAFCYECIGRSSYWSFCCPFYSKWALAFLTVSLPAEAMFINFCTLSLHCPSVCCLLISPHHKFPSQSCRFSGKFAGLPEYWEGLIL